MVTIGLSRMFGMIAPYAHDRIGDVLSNGIRPVHDAVSHAVSTGDHHVMMAALAYTAGHLLMGNLINDRRRRFGRIFGR